VSKDFFYTTNTLLEDSPENVTFSWLRFSSDKQYHDWVVKLRKRIRYNWDKHGSPPVVGSHSVESIVRDFNGLSRKRTDDMVAADDLTHEKDCVISRGSVGNACNNFFPTMFKTKDADLDVSLYDLFYDRRKLEGMKRTFRRNFKRDSFFVYCQYALGADTKKTKRIVPAKSGKEWIKRFANQRPSDYKHCDFWFQEKMDNRKAGPQGKLTISKKEIEELRKAGLVKARHIRTIDIPDGDGFLPYKKIPDTQRFWIRWFDTRTRIFPHGYRSFNTGLIIRATNFPPLIAKHLYQRFTEHIKDQDRIVIYDPSSGWGGRMLGALAAGADRNIHYVGTDPNPDCFIPELGISRYEYLGDFYNDNVRQSNYTTYELFQSGSEVIQKERRFHKYKGKIDLVFTSPPYFNAEGYSDDKNQSSVKFPEYDAWRDGFLKQTLATAVKYLKSGGYLLWNIADIQQGSKMLPLEYDTREILGSLGMDYKTKLKFVLAHSPGGGRVGKVTRKPTHKNFAEIGGGIRKYEPIFVYQKP